MALASSPLIFNHETGWESSGALLNLPAVVVVAIALIVLMMLFVLIFHLLIYKHQEQTLKALTIYFF